MTGELQLQDASELIGGTGEWHLYLPLSSRRTVPRLFPVVLSLTLRTCFSLPSLASSLPSSFSLWDRPPLGPSEAGIHAHSSDKCEGER